MPQLDTLKKHAKQLVRWRRDGQHTVAERLRNGLPRFAAMTDAQILASDFTLAQAQEIIARENGFETWAALKADQETALDAPKWTTPAPLLGANTSTVFVADMATAVAFYVEVLGFRVAYLYGEPPFYGMVVRDGARIQLRYVCEPVFAGDIREREDLHSASIDVDNPKALYLEFKAAGAPFHQDFRKEPWGSQGFVVRDPDGNLIAFGGLR
jgi:catechol 2,3-dioxygenase-like lactoylglutathione lyase family enzyme